MNNETTMNILNSNNFNNNNLNTIFHYDFLQFYFFSKMKEDYYD